MPYQERGHIVQVSFSNFGQSGAYTIKLYSFISNGKWIDFVENWCLFDCQSITPGGNAIKLFTAVIYCRSMVIPSFFVIKWYYYGTCCGMLVSNTMVIYHGILTLEKEGTAVNYLGIFITLAIVF